jgi:DNA repair protein RecN (Recombination protein N)
VLLELAVENYAVVDRLRVRFHAGLNLLTGETGSGKSIVVDALGLLLGGRSSAEMIRSGSEKARISGVFEADERAAAVLEQAGFDSGETGDLLLEREILANGKGRVYVNNRPATVALLRDLAGHLGDIHGQHDQQLLFDPVSQLALLDTFADARPQRAKVRELFGAWRKSTDRIAELEAAAREKTRLLEIWQFQRKEIESAALRVGEDAELEIERRVQQNSGRLLELASASWEALYEGPGAVWPVARTVARKLDDLSKIDESMIPVRQALEPALIAIQDVAYTLRDYVGRVEANPARLEEIENRLAAIDRLKRKYGTGLGEILEFLADVTRKIGEVENSSEVLASLQKERAALGAKYEEAASALTALRRAKAEELGRRVEEELKPLAMDRTVFRIAVQPAEWSESGADRILFLVSPNAGEEPKPLEKIASGGELSRIALALKTCLVGTRTTGNVQRILVFDEIDTGIGGRAAEGVARRLKKLAAESQVICVTHLAQIACFADHHYRVGKFERNGRMVSEIEELDAKTSTEEIGRMLSGQRLTPEAIRNAEELVRAARA